MKQLVYIIFHIVFKTLFSPEYLHNLQHPTEQLSAFSPNTILYTVLPMELWEGFFFVFADWLEAHDAQVNSFPIPFPVVAMQLHNQMHDKPKVNRLYSENSPMTGTEIFVQYTRLICVCVSFTSREHLCCNNRCTPCFQCRNSILKTTL